MQPTLAHAIPFEPALPALGLSHRLLREEPANCMSHAVGLALSVGGAMILLPRAATAGGWRFAACGVYVATLIFLYASSMLSHAFREAKKRHFYRALDQGAIFLLIAGTYTPFAAIDAVAVYWPLSALVWLVALAGFCYKVVLRQQCLGFGSMLTYVGLGWLPGIALLPVLIEMPEQLFEWLLAGGVCYMAGTVFLVLDHRIPRGHLAWHLFVIAGSICHFIAVYAFAATPLALA